jgi:ABC-2 type transport system permease protein
VNGLTQGWLVARREVRERSRSRAFQASLVLMIVLVVGIVVVPSLVEGGGDTREVGVTGDVPEGLPSAIEEQAAALDTAVRVRRYDDVASGEQALRDGDLDVLVVDAQRLEWRRQTDPELRPVVSGAIQLVAVRERAAQVGISEADLSVLVTPVPVEDVELGSVPGRSADDETVVMVMTVLLFLAITTYGNLVLTGVVEEKTSRVVEVLLARMPARTLLAGKVTGIGLLGLAQFTVTALAAFIAITVTDAVDLPAARGGVVAWAIVWFVLGYAVYAVAYGALGSLASRTEDAQSAVGPVQVVLVVAYFASFVAIGRPDDVFAKVLSYVPVTAPLAMPARIAMGATAWWEPVAAAAFAIVTIVALVRLGGRVYESAILRSGPTLKVREALRAGPEPGPTAASQTSDVDHPGPRAALVGRSRRR